MENRTELNVGYDVIVYGKNAVIVAQLGKENDEDKSIWFEVMFDNGSKDHCQLDDIENK